MASHKMHRPPAPVVAAIVFYALLAVVMLVFAVVVAVGGAPVLALLGLVGLLPGSVALGLWQGNRGARVAAIVFAFPSILGTPLMVLLLAVPASSRDWFTPEEFEENAFIEEDDDEDETVEPVDLAQSLYKKLSEGVITRDEAIAQMQAADPRLSTGAASYQLNRPFYEIVRDVQNKLRERVITRDEAIGQIQAADPRLGTETAASHLDHGFNEIVRDLQGMLHEGVITRQEAITQIQAADRTLTPEAAAYFLDQRHGPTIVHSAKLPPKA